MPNTLLLAQEAANAPFGKESGVTRDMYIQKVKAKDAETQYDMAKDEGVQCDQPAFENELT